MIPAHQTRIAWTRYAILLVVGIHLLSAGWHVLYGGQNVDEGFYALAARSVWQGELPYRDFGYTQMPLLPYINGLMMQFTGFGLFEQRAVNGLWGALTLLLAAVWLARRTNTWWALGLVALFSLSAPWMYFIHLGKTYAFVGLVMVAAVWVFTEWTPRAGKVATLALLGTLGVGCRLPVAPYFALLWLAALIELPEHSGKTLGKSVAGSLVWPAVFVLPFFLAAPEAALFWTFGLHRATLPGRDWYLPWQVTAPLAPALWLGFAGVLIRAVLKRDLPERKDIIVAAATVVALASSLLPQGVFEEYGVPLLPPLAMVTFLGLWRAGRTITWLRHPLVPGVLLVANLGLSVALQWPFLPADRRDTWSMFLPLKAPAYNFALPNQIADARQVVEQGLPPDRPFVGPSIILAVETGRHVPRNLRMGPFSATSEYYPDKAQRLNLATLRDVEAYFTDPHGPMLALSKNPYNNYSSSMPSFQKCTQFRSFVWSEYFRRDFRVAYEDDDFFILVRKKADPTLR